MENSLRPSQLIEILKPLFTICKYFGYTSFEIGHQNQNIKKIPKSSFWYWNRIMAFILTTSYICFQITSLIISTLGGENVFYLLSQSLWLEATIVPYCTLAFAFFRGGKFDDFINRWILLEHTLDTLFCPYKTNCYMRNLKIIYWTSAMLSCGMCGYYTATHPFERQYPAHYFGPMGPMLESFVTYGYAGFQTLIIAWTWVGCAMLEIFCSIFASVVVQCLVNIRMVLEQYNSEQEKSIFKMQVSLP